jgi:hypothetical protein
MMAAVPSFSTFFEIVFDPAAFPSNWLCRRPSTPSVALTDERCLIFLREIIDLVIGRVALASVHDVGVLAEEEYNFAIGYFYFAQVSTPQGLQLQWSVASGDPQSYAANRAWDIIQARKNVPGATPVQEAELVDTAPIWKAPVEEQPLADTKPVVAVAGRCYLCARKGSFFGSPKICSDCRNEHFPQQLDLILNFEGVPLIC